MKQFSLQKMRTVKLRERFSVLKNLEFLHDRKRDHRKVAFPANEISIIAEIKKASPGNVFNTNADPVRQATLYEKGGAAAVSVLVDGNFFSGSWKDLNQASAAVTVPVLCKEFIYYTEQIDMAYYCGADMVLLIAQTLTFTELETLYAYARSRNLMPIVEINTVKEIDRVLMCGPEYVMVNMRNLNTLAISIESGIDVLRELPDTVTKISASGISSADDIRRIHDATGTEVFLVGSSLMKSGDPLSSIRAMRSVLHTAGKQ
ncbi:MAG: indole-3-glycerol phosphate synthase TrpC [Spirochaetota bacterium]